MGEEEVLSQEDRAKYFTRHGFVNLIKEATPRDNDALRLSHATNQVEMFPENEEGGIGAFYGQGGVQRFLERLDSVMSGSDRTVKSVDIPNNQMTGRLYLCNEKVRDSKIRTEAVTTSTGACPLCGSDGPDHNAIPLG